MMTISHIDEYEEIDDLIDYSIDIDDSNSSIWQPDPHNKPQCMAYELARSGKVMQLGYGGQAGGGKTDLLLGLASTVFRDSIIFRREYQQLDKIVERGDELFPARFISGDKKRWLFNGRRIVLRSMQHEKDWRKYQGQGRPFIGLDEAAEFTKLQVKAVSGWQRTTDEKQHTLLMLTFNPPTTPEGEWIIEMFAPWIAPDYSGVRAKNGEIRWFINVDGKETEVNNGDIVTINNVDYYPISRTFIQASRHDNPYLKEDYERVLSNLPEPLRSMLMYGDFTLSAQDDRWQVIPTNWTLAAMERGRNSKRPDVAMRSMGVDVAHGGADNTVIAPVYGNWFDELIVRDTPDAQTAAHEVILARGSHVNVPINVDAIGYGAGCSDILSHMDGVDCRPINVGSASNITDISGVYKFANLRSQIFWQLREALDPDNGDNIALPDDRDLRVELSSIRYKITGGKIRVEAKEDIIKRLGRSPDRADAVALAWYGCVNSYNIVSFTGSLV